MSGQRKALIIANDEYEQEALQNLLAPGADAEALGRVLGDRKIGDFAVQVMRNQPSYVIDEQIEDLFADSRPDDVLLLHFSGHGLKSESGELFFAASNTRPNRLRSTSVPADFVQRCMRDSRSRSIVLLLDCCYGGAFAQGVKVRAAGDINVLDSFPQGRSGGGRGRAVITASTAMEYAFEGDRLSDDQHQRPSVFTSALVQGLATGDADRDEDGLVSLNELYDYIFDKVREQNPHQTPSRQVELEGELYLARSQRRRIRPAPIPPDLQAAITHQNMYTRRGAVSELQSRLASEDLPVAAGAYEALTEVARTDIQYVADLATAALSESVVRPEETEVHFGERRQGSEAPHQLVRLLGFPIARACVPRVSHDWIRVNETTEGFDISVDTSSTGTLRGSVDLKGPTGTAVIAVDVELLPQEARTSPPHHPLRSADGEVTAPAVPADQPQRQSAADGRPEALQAAKRKAAGRSGRNAAKAAEPQAAAPDLASAPTTEVPAMPNIGLGEQVADAPYPLLDGFSPTIGWQFRRQEKGGPAYVIIRRGALGMLKVVETFPLTEDGWASAWQALLSRNPAAVPQVLAILRAREKDTRR
jgi:Caspase domain